MSKNSPGSPWIATPRHMRRRKPLSITLSDGARELLECLAHHATPSAPKALSAVVEGLIWREGERLGYRKLLPALFKQKDSGE